MEHDVPQAGLPDPGKISARLRCHDDQALLPASQRPGSFQVVDFHNDHARDRQIRAVYQVNLMHAVSYEEIAQRIRVLGIAYGQLDSLHGVRYYLAIRAPVSRFREIFRSQLIGAISDRIWLTMWENLRASSTIQAGSLASMARGGIRFAPMPTAATPAWI